MPDQSGFLIILPPPQMSVDDARHLVHRLLFERTSTPVAATIYPPMSPPQSSSVADAVAGWISSRLMGPTHEVHPTRAMYWETDDNGRVNTASLTGAESVARVLEGLREDGAATEVMKNGAATPKSVGKRGAQADVADATKRGAREANIDSPAKPSSGSRRKVRADANDHQMAEETQPNPATPQSPDRAPTAPRALFPPEESAPADGSEVTMANETVQGDEPGEPTTRSQEGSQSGRNSGQNSHHEAHDDEGEGYAADADGASEPESVNSSSSAATPPLPGSRNAAATGTGTSAQPAATLATAPSSGYFQGQTLDASSSLAGLPTGFGMQGQAPSATSSSGQPFGVGMRGTPAGGSVFGRSSASLGGGAPGGNTSDTFGFGGNAPPRPPPGNNTEGTREPHNDFSFLTDMGFDLVDRSTGGNKRSASGGFRVVFMHLPPGLRTEERILTLVRQRAWRAAHGDWPELSDDDYMAPEVSIVEMPARKGKGGKGRGKGAGEPMFLAFLTFPQEQVAAALLRQDGTIRARGSRSIAIDIARPTAALPTGMCYNCYQTGHFARECISAAACRRCRQTGHTATECTAAATAAGGQPVCHRCGDPTHHAGLCHWSNATINEDSEQRTGTATLERWGSALFDPHAARNGNANPAGAGTAGAGPGTPAGAWGATPTGTPSTTSGSQAAPVSTPEMANLSRRLDELESAHSTSHNSLLTAIDAQATAVDAGFEEARQSQAGAVDNLRTSIRGNITHAVREQGQATATQLASIMKMMSQITGIPLGSAQAQVAAAAQPQLGNGGATPGANIQQITLAGSNFADAPAAPSAPPQASSSYTEARDQARLATQRAREGRTLAGAPGVLDGHTEPALGGDRPGTEGPPQ